MITKLNAGLLGDGCLCGVWLGLLTALNQSSLKPVTLIFPYLVPVVFMTWRHGISWGFAVCGLATFAAIPGDYLSGHDLTELSRAGIATYLKLSSVAAGFALARYLKTLRYRDH